MFNCFIVIEVELAAEISFKQATHQDRAFLLQLRKLSMVEHLENADIYLDDEQHYARIDEFFADSYLILRNQDPIGLLKLGVFIDRLHIRQFQILPEYQGSGIGSKILAVVKEKAQAKNRAITLNVLLNNPAKQLYARHGFVVMNENALEFNMRWQSPILAP